MDEPLLCFNSYIYAVCGWQAHFHVPMIQGESDDNKRINRNQSKHDNNDNNDKDNNDDNGDKHEVRHST